MANNKYDIFQFLGITMSTLEYKKLRTEEQYILRQILCLPSGSLEYALLKELVHSHKVLPEMLDILTEKGWLLRDKYEDAYILSPETADIIRINNTIMPESISVMLATLTDKLTVPEEQQDDDIYSDINTLISCAELILSRFEAEHIEHNELIARVQRSLAIAVKNKNRYQDSYDLFKTALETYLLKLDDETYEIAEMCAEMASLLQILNRDAEVPYYLEKAVHGFEVHFGEDHPHTALHYGYLAASLQKVGEYEEALDFAQKAFTILSQKFPPNSPFVNELVDIIIFLKQNL